MEGAGVMVNMLACLANGPGFNSRPGQNLYSVVTDIHTDTHGNGQTHSYGRNFAYLSKND